jgi:hypothetical protein
MIGILNEWKLKYVFFHLEQHVNLSTELKGKIKYIHGNQSNRYTNSIVFSQSAKGLDLNQVIEIDGIPVLFPCTESKSFYQLDENGNLIFFHDLLKSAFYLLSGYQEYENSQSADQLGRFSYVDSIQHKLGIINKPLVNYYFEIIIQGIELYCNRHNLPFARKRLFPSFGFLLSHDIDKVDKYDAAYFLYKTKQLIGAAATRLSKAQNFKLAVKGFATYLGITKKSNPYWNFEWMREQERNHHFRSTFYFLDKGLKHADAEYSFSEERMIKLFQFIQEEGCEVGLHGTVESISSREKMQSSYNLLMETSETPIVGIRQHRLLWKHPQTGLIQQSVGLKYDTTLGFAAHEGFRNSYCYPFKLYDFAKDEMIDLWEVPLNVMDVTLFAYQNYSYQEAFDRCQLLIKEAKRFGGTLSLLWHNSYFEEEVTPGITQFYIELLIQIKNQNPINLTGKELSSILAYE